MPATEEDLIARIAAGEKIASAEDLPPGYRGELMRLMVVFVDSELAGAAGFVPFINSAPGLKARSIAARMVSEKFAHAQAVLELLAEFGVDAGLYVRSYAWDARLDRTIDLGSRRIPGDKRLNVFHYPIQGWVDSVTMNMLMGTASSIQLGDQLDCSYAPLAAVLREIVNREAEHAALGETGLARAIEHAEDTAPAQVALDYWYPRVAATFGRMESERFEQYQRYGLRKHSNAELLEAWTADIGPRLVKLGLVAPVR